MTRSYSMVRFAKAVDDPQGAGGLLRQVFLASDGYTLSSEGAVFSITAPNGGAVDVCGVEWQGRLIPQAAPESKKGKKAT